jgi:hypothetical protein
LLESISFTNKESTLFNGYTGSNVKDGGMVAPLKTKKQYVLVRSQTYTSYGDVPVTPDIVI